MNVWLINHYAVPPSEAGGTRHFSLARTLIAQGHSVTIIASDVNYFTRSNRYSDRGEAVRLEAVDGVLFTRLRGIPYRSSAVVRVLGMVSFALKVWRIRKLRNLPKPDVVLGSSPHPFAALAAERIANCYRIPFILEVRDLWPKTLIALGSMSRFHPLVLLFAAIEGFVCRQAVRIVTLLPEAARHLVRKGANPAAIVWIPNGIDPDLVGAYPLPGNRQPFTIMYVGAHGIANALDDILDAAAHLKRLGFSEKFRIRFIGDGSEKPRLRNRAETEGLESISFEGPVSKQQIYPLMAEADAFVACMRDSPLYDSGMSLNKLFDYLYMGRPIVFAAGLAYNPVRQANAGITVPANDSPALAGAIKCLMELPLEERRAMGKRGHDFVRAKHNMRDLGKHLAGVLEAAVHEYRN